MVQSKPHHLSNKVEAVQWHGQVCLPVELVFGSDVTH